MEFKCTQKCGFQYVNVNLLRMDRNLICNYYSNLEIQLKSEIYLCIGNLWNCEYIYIYGNLNEASNYTCVNTLKMQCKC